MTTANISINPAKTTNAAGSFNIDSAGFIQGFAQADPSTFARLVGGVLANTETIPMWGGVAITESVPVPGYNPASLAPAASLGGSIARATGVGGEGVAGSVTGFSVFDQNFSAVNSPQSEVPLVPSGGGMMFYRLYSLARIPLLVAPTLAAALAGNPINQNVSWDFVNQQLMPYFASWIAASVSSATYNSTTGALALTFGAAPLGAGVGTTANGVYLAISGLAGTGNVAGLVGSFPITGTASSGTVVTVQAPTGLGSISITGSTGTLAAGGGYIASLKVLRIKTTNSMGVQFDPTTNFAKWNRNAAVALCQI